MLFAGLVSSVIILRAGGGALAWPGGPRLNTPASLANIAVLLASGVSMHLAHRANRIAYRAARLWLVMTWALGAVFLLIQGAEWARLAFFGLTASSSLYGATFYALVTAHGLHVVAGVVVLTVVAIRAFATDDTERRGHMLALCRIYWWYVVALWPPGVPPISWTPEYA